MENADSYTWFCELKDARDQHDAEDQKRREAEDAAKANAEAIWAAYQAGALELSHSSFTTPEGVVIEPDLVASTVFDWFRAHDRAHFDEICEWLNAHEPATFTSVDGTVFRKELVEVVLWHIS